jgi:hypothetical protein
MGRCASLSNLRNSAGGSGLRAFSWVVLILVSGRGRVWHAHRSGGSDDATGDGGSRRLSWASKGALGGFSSIKKLPSRLLLRSSPRRLPSLGSLQEDSAGGVAGRTRGGEESENADAYIFACFALVWAGRVFVCVDAGLSFRYFLAAFLLRLRLADSLSVLAWGLKLSRRSTLYSFFLSESIAVKEAAFATRDSRTELGINTICARPTQLDMGGAVAGELWSR